MALPGVTLSGKIETITGVADPGTVTVTLQNYGSNAPVVSGTAQVAVVATVIQAAADGTWSTPLWGNDQIAPPNTYYTVVITTSDNVKVWSAAYVINSGVYDLSNLQALASVPTAATPSGAIVNNPTGPQQINTYGLTVPSLAAGSIAAASLNAAIMLGGGSAYTTLAAALAALPSTGGTILVAPNYAETLAADITISKINTHIKFLGPAVLTMGTHQIVVPSGTHNVTIESPFPWGGYPGPVTPGVTFDYRGSGAAIKIGDGTTLTLNSVVHGIYFSLGQALAGSIAIQASYVQQYSFRYARINGSGTVAQIGILINGPTTGAYSGSGEIVWPYMAMQATGSVGIRYASLGTGAVNHTIIRGAVLTGANLGATAIDIVPGNSSGSNFGTDLDIEGWQTAGINFGAGTSNNEFYAHFEANAANKDVVFALGVNNNIVRGDHAGADLQYTDNSGTTTNKVWSQGDLLYGTLQLHGNATLTNFDPNIPGYRNQNLFLNVMGGGNNAAGMTFGKGGTVDWYVGDDGFSGGSSLNFEIKSAAGKGISIAKATGTTTVPSLVASAVNGTVNAAQYADLQTAIANLPNGQGVVELPPGTYNLATTLTLTSSISPFKAIRLRGAEASSVIIQATADNFTMINMGVNSILENVTIISNGHTGLSGINAHSNCVTRNVRIVGAGFTNYPMTLNGSVSGAFGVFYSKHYNLYIDAASGADYGLYMNTVGMPGLNWVNNNQFYSPQIRGCNVAAYYLNGASMNQFYGIDAEANPGVGFWLELGSINAIYGGDLEGNTKGPLYINPANLANESTIIQVNSIDSWAQLVSTTGTIALGTPTTLTVASATNIVPGKPITITGAGAAGAALTTRVIAVSGTTVTIADAASTAVAGTSVTGPTINATGTYTFQTEQSTFQWGGWYVNPQLRGDVKVNANIGSANATATMGTGTTAWFLRDSGGNSRYKLDFSSSTPIFTMFGATSGSTGIQPAAVASGILTLPAATDQLVARATTDTLTNKSISGTLTLLSQTLGIGNGAATNLTALAKSTGTGPASLAVVQWQQISVNGTTYFLPLFQ